MRIEATNKVFYAKKNDKDQNSGIIDNGLNGMNRFLSIPEPRFNYNLLNLQNLADLCNATCLKLFHYLAV
jgi:hypothetical protein